MKERTFRIGEKIISLDKAAHLIERAMELREQGFSQQEAARRLNLDRSFISRIEASGEIRKGSKVAVIGFPLSNAAELADLCHSYGLDYFLLLDNRQRWDLVKDRQALDFFNHIFEMIARLREFDTLVMISSEKWYHLAEVLLDLQIIYIDLGPTPIQEDRYFDPKQLRETLEMVLEKKRKENRQIETHSGN
ncbi:MAG: helix-turn-helix transcriptional regulator [Bacillota bacterium]